MSSQKVSIEENCSPLDHLFPEVLSSRVVRVGSTPLIHGFDSWNDLGSNFSSAERLLISLTGEEPEPQLGEILERLMVAFSPRGIDEPPAHSGVITRLFSRSEGCVMSNVLLALGAQADALYEWLFEEGEVAMDLSDAARWFQGEHSTENEIDARAVFCAALTTCGLTERWQVSTLWIQSALPAVIAESMSATPLDFERYPMNLPPIELIS